MRRIVDSVELRRWVHGSLTNFSTNSDLAISNLRQKIESEAEGVINIAIMGLERLLNHNGFTESATIQDCVKRVISESNPFLNWWNDRIEITENEADYVFTSRLHDDYCEYARPPLRPTIFKFGRMLSKQVKIEQKKGMGLSHSQLKKCSVVGKGLTGIKINML